MQHAEKRHNVWYAKLTVPADVRHVIGKVRFFQSTQTASSTEAAPRVALLVALWRSQITKARGSLPDPKATFWEALRRDLIDAKGRGDAATEAAIFDIAEEAAGKITDPDEASRLFKFGTDHPDLLLAPIVEDWKGSLKLAQKTIDQQHRDVLKMAAHFGSVESLTPQKIKAWTDKLLAGGMTASSFERIGNGCRSFWLYLQQAGTKGMDDLDPFVGPFKLAQRRAVATDTGRAGNSYTPEQVTALYLAAIDKGDKPLADLIALGAYTGARIEELCQITKETAKNGVFHIGTKTKASNRFLPIHPAIAPLVSMMFAASKDDYLILSAADNQYENRSGPLSQRFGHLKKELGYGRAHVFHTMRGTLITLLRHADVSSEVISAVAGHATGNFSLDKYTRGGSYTQQLEAISKVAYPGPLDKP